ncbi:MAG TPA: hypothetical protein VM425_09615 [Myxococcota bacterium]|nr:hypothetical protein [Myxococcota bacterium]
MTHRISMVAVVLLFSACTAESAVPREVRRPAAAGNGEARAFVQVVSGPAKIRATSGFVFDAKPSLPLLIGDEIEAPADGFVVLRLTNGYLVRVDSGVALRVGDIVLLSAPRASQGLAAQLDRLLSKEERQQGERIAGWHARLTGAETVPTQQAEEDVSADKTEVRHRSLKDFGAESNAPMEAVLVDKKKPQATASKVQSKSTGFAGAREAKEQAAVPGGAGDGRVVVLAWRTRVGDKERVEKGPPPELVGRMINDGTLSVCLGRAVAGLPKAVRPRAVEVRIELAGHQIVRIVLGGGLPLPACLTGKHFHEKMTLGPADGWVIFKVPLP